MIRTILSVALALLLAAAAIGTIRVDTDARAMFGERASAVEFLDQPEGRTVTILLHHPLAGRAVELTRELASRMSSDPMVSGILSPVSDVTEVSEFLWDNRYGFAAPGAKDWTAGAMTHELANAREALTGLGTGDLAARYLLDPSGSFRRLVEHLGQSDLAPIVRDDKLGMVVLLLAEKPFQVDEQSAFDARIHAWADNQGAKAIVLGPRPISARVSAHIADSSVWAAGIGSVLLLCWLTWASRALRAVVMTLLPLALGFGAAALATQFMFGSVHVLALGFGGALLGLALDYPIHLLSHSGALRAHAVRCVKLGAATTAIAFGALTLAGPPALAQVGVFVATGLLVSAIATLCLGPEMPTMRAVQLTGFRGYRLPGRLLVLAGVLAGSVAGLALLPDRKAEALAPPPPDVLADIAELRKVMELPSGRYSVEVTGQDLSDVLDAQIRLKDVLAELVERGSIQRAAMLVDHLPHRRPNAGLPSVEEVSLLLPRALRGAGLDPAFAERIAVALSEGLSAADTIPPAVPSPMTALIYPDGAGMKAPVRIWHVSDPEALATAVGRMNDPRVRFLDRQAWIVEGIAIIRADMIRALGFGVLAAIVVIAFSTGRAAPAIVLGTAAATALAGFGAGALFGGLGVFQLMALVLVMGIGIDYGLLAAPDHDQAAGIGSSDRCLVSILLCAGSTVLAFGAMALSGVSVLAEIGTTVVFGVLAMVLVVLWRAEGQE